MSVALKKEQSAHYQRLCAALKGVVTQTLPVGVLRKVAAAAIAKGLPVDPEMLFAPDFVLESEARYACLAIPSLRAWHGDARAWIEVKLKKVVKEGSLAWNMAVGGTVIGEN